MSDQAPSSLGRRGFLGSVAAASVLGVSEPSHATPVGARAPLSKSAAASGPRAPQRAVRFGLNYTPSKNWWYSWTDWDAASINQDLADIASIGMDHIRIMMLWPELQPNSTYIRTGIVDRLHEFLNMADTAGLDVEVTVLNGQVSGFLFVTPWLLNGGTAQMTNFFTDSASITAQQELFTALAAKVGSHPRFLGFDLANEIHWFAMPFGINLATADGDAWAQTMFATAEQAAPGKLHVNGLDHFPWLNDGFFSRPGVSNAGTLTANHTWAGWTGVFGTYGPMSTASLHYSEYFIELIKAFQTDLTRQVWIEETGVSDVWMSSKLIPGWTKLSIQNMVSCSNLWGITWWCSHDPSTRFAGFNPLEYTLGVFTNDHQLKPIGKTIQALVAEYDQNPPQPIQRTSALVLPDSMVPWTPFFVPFMKLVHQGTRPAVVLESMSTNQAYLQARGITTLIHLSQV
ncbi:MAG TPA: cellulase family glycosylhydrolase [Streptosporangiaceae bacterium]|nr:cellulase family glycosylhydrolase [Streptosporangiaceae bacterium]